MENPATWGRPERIVHRAIEKHLDSMSEGRTGLSLTRRITDALRDEGLLVEDETDSPR